MDTPKLTGLKKRQQIQKANKTMFMWVIAASAAIAVCLVLAQFMVRQFLYNNKVIGKQTTTQQVLDSNLSSFDSLKESVTKLTANSNLSALKIAETDTALQVIIDALPTSDDRAVLGTSLQQVVLARSGVGIESINVTSSGGLALVDPTLEDSVASVDTPIEITFDLVLIGNYEQISSAIRDMERSIRPIDVSMTKVEGNGQQLRATIAAKTYYLPPKSVDMKVEKVEP